MKTVYLGMTADIIHPGLINIIREAARYGEVMIGLLTDEAIAEHKRLPHLSYKQRKEIIENIKGVAKVVPQAEWSYVNNLRQYQPNYIIHGDDWETGAMAKVREDVFNVMKELGGEVIEIPYTQGITSASLSKEIIGVGTTPDIRLKRLRRLLAAKKVVRILEAHSGLSGLIIENVEVFKNDKRLSFDGMWSSSLTDSTCKGKPDIEAVDLTTRLQDLNNILECTTKPIIFDGDTGGKDEHFVFTVRTLERHGVSAVIIEDKVGLKRNSLFGTDVEQHQATIEEFCYKIKAGKNAQVTKDFMIIARIESLICGKSVGDALERAYAYVQVGADGIMIHSKHKTGDDIKEFCQAFREKDKTTPLVVVPTTFNHIAEDELNSWGINIVIYANHMLRASYPAMLKAANIILENQRSKEVDSLCMPIKEILELIRGTKYQTMVAPKRIFDLLQSNKISLFTGVPDSLLKDFCAYITDHTDEQSHIIAANEGAAVGIAAGQYLANSKPALVYMQNSGIGNAINPLLSLADEKVYKIPMLLMVGWRGEPGVKDEPQHIKQGEVTLALFDAMQIPYTIIDSDEEKAVQQFKGILAGINDKSVPHAAIIRKNIFASYKLQKRSLNHYEMSREDALKVVVDALQPKDLIVSTTGKLSRELFEYRECKHEGHDKDFLTVGSMGHSSSIAFGIALNRPDRTVFCLDGDGAVLMHMGALASIGVAGLKNFKHIIFNNGAHESVGGQPTVGFKINIADIAKNNGYKFVHVAETKAGLSDILKHVQHEDGPVLVEIKLNTQSRENLGRPTTTTIENKIDFMENINKK